LFDKNRLKSYHYKYMKNKTFDCVQMKRRGSELVRKQLEGKSFKQQLEYWQEGTSELKKLQRQIKNKE
jgi:hypothetical protein